ncbi:MAG: amino acid adenylation domain-containing protein [Flavobacteriales bacterium]|jgi:amino acid adenylation domain-containing protein
MITRGNDRSDETELAHLSDTTFIDEIVLSHSDRTPSAVAIRFEDKNITYEELGGRVASLAQYLIGQGVQTGDFVVALLEPSEHIIIALLAIARIGAIYTPLDPDHPDTQLYAKYQSTNAKCTVTHQKYATRVQHWADRTVIIDNLEHQLNLAAHQTANPLREINAPACIFFTSGTTGKAKGVLGSAKAMRNAIVGPAQDLNFSNGDTLNSIARYGWSISMLELIGPLIAGGTTLILSPKRALELDWLKAQVESCTTFHCPPALLRNFAHHVQQNYPNNHSFEHIRLVWYGGDTFAPSHIDTMHSVFPNALIGTAYGCTEIFGLSHVYFYPRGKTHKVLIGKAVSGIQQLILNEESIPAIAGQQGEILLAGDRLTSEYWQAPDINAEKFTSIDGTKYFLTGDFALLDESGDLEFIQRKDDQVKIRGIRIELGEIEQTLNALDTVQEAIVLAVDIHSDDTQTDDRELRAYIVTKKGVENKDVENSDLEKDAFGKDAVGKESASIINALKQSITENLPDYMMPAQWFLLDSLPVTENFKIDRKTLTALTQDEIKSPSLQGTAAKIAEVWADVTRRTPNSIDDVFFQSGGNSLTATQLAVKLGRTFKVKIQVADIYRNPTLSAQVAIVNTLTMSRDAAVEKNIEKIANKSVDNSKDSPVPLPATTSPDVAERIYATQGQVGLFFREMLGSQGHSITCARYISSPESFNEEWVRQALDVLMKRYPTLTTNIKISRPHLELIENSYAGSDITFSRLQQGWSLAENADLPLIKQMHKFDIRKSPLISAIVCPMKEGGEILQLTGHHIACDDNSMRRIAKEFVALYDSIKTNKQISLPQVSENYKEFAQLQHKNITAGAYQTRAKIVADRLCSTLPQCQDGVLLKVEKNTAVSSVHFEGHLNFNLNNSVFAQYIAALSSAFHRIFGRTEFVFCAHSAMLRDSEKSPTVGMYINLVPVITGYNPDHTIRQHVQRSTIDFNRAMAQSDIPYEVILNENETLKKLKKFPFDAFINELSFVETFIPGYKNEIVPEPFATNNNEMNVTVVETLDGKHLHLESPSVDNIDDIHKQVLEHMSEFLQSL